jgi:hypothetical protein
MSTRTWVETQRDIAAAHDAPVLNNLLWRRSPSSRCWRFASSHWPQPFSPTLADRLTFLLLGWVPCSVSGLRFSALLRTCDAATFAVTLVMFLIYGLARKGGRNRAGR